jgi:flagellar hook-length control protein FliK
MLPDLALVPPTSGPRSSGAAGEAASAEGGADPFAALLAALSQPRSAPPAPTPAQAADAAGLPMPAVLAQPVPREPALAPIPLLQPEPEPDPPPVVERASGDPGPTGDPRPWPIAGVTVAPPAARPRPVDPMPRQREVAGGAWVEAATPGPAPPAHAGCPPPPSPPASPAATASLAPRPEALAAAGPLVRQDGAAGRHDAAAGPPPEARPDPLAAAPRPAPPAAASPDARPPGLQIALQIVHAAPHRIEQMRVQLHPAALGQVEIRLEFGEHGRLRALIAVERPETLEALQRDAQALERALHDAGLRPDPGALSFSLRRERDPCAQDAPRAAAAGHAGQGGSGEVEPEPVPWRSGRHLIDVHV